MKKMKTTKWVTLLALIMLLLTPPRALFAETELVTQELRITNDAEPLSVVVSSSTYNSGCTTATVTFTISGGTAPYQYKVDDGTFATIEGNSITLSDLPLGNHIIYILDAVDERASTTIALSPVQLIAAESASICSGQSVSLSVTASGGTAPYTFSWKEGDTEVCSSAQYDFPATTVTAATMHTYDVTVTDGNGCSATTTTTLTINPNPAEPNITGTLAVCPGSGVNLGVDDPSGDLTYTWTSTETVIDNSTSITSCNLWVPTYFTLTAKDVNGCTSSTTQLVTINDTVELQVTNPTQTICLHQEITPIICTYDNATINTSDITLPTGLTLSVEEPEEGEGVPTIIIAGAITTGDTYTFNIIATSNQTPACNPKTQAITIVVRDYSGPTLTSTITDVKCHGDATGSISVTATGGSSPYQYQLNDGTFQNEASFSGLSADSYTITVKDGNGCSTTEPFAISQPDELKATIATTAVKCNGGTDGIITITATGGTTPRNYSISPVAGTGTLTTSGKYTFSGLTAGTYSVTVEDDNNCSFTVYNIQVTEPALLTATATTTPASCNGVEDGTITIAATGGNGSNKYTLNGTSNTTGVFTGIGAGTYSVTVEDDNNCSFTVYNIQVTEPALLEITSTSTTAVSCFGGNNGSITVNISGGNYTTENPYTYTLSNGTTTTAITAATSATFNNLPAGNYTVTVEDYNNCEVTKTGIQVTQPDALPTITITAPSNICSPHTTTITAAGGVSYLWNDGSTTASITISSEGTYSVTGTDAIGCQNNATVTIEGCLPQLTITSASESWTYDGNPHANNSYAVTYDGNPISAVDGSNGLKFALPTGDTLRIASTSSPVTNVADSYTGNNTFTYTLDNDFKYPTPSSTNGTLTVTTRPITLTANSKTDIMYDGTEYTYAETADPHYTISGDGLVSGQSITDITITGSGTAAGTYPTTITAGSVVIKEGATDVTGNYDITLVNGELVIGLPNMKDSLFCNNSTFNTLPTTGHPDGTITYTWTVVDNPNVTGESNMTTPQSSISQVLSNNNTTAVETVIYTVTPHTALGEELFPFELQVSVYPSNILSITCPDDIDIMLNFGECDYTFTTIGNAATSYSNSIFTEHNWNVTLSNNAPADLTFSAGNHVVVWTLSDECGNTVTCTQNVNINYPACPDAVDFDNNVYPSVRIGCECWTAVNLRSVHYADGSIIDDRYSYTSLLYPDAVENVNRFGELYSYYAAVKAPEGSTPVANAYGHIPGICPDGWYLPTEEQFLSLNAYPVIQLKSPLYWINGGGTNETGFSALPAGYYDGFDYRFKNLYGSTYFWSTSNDASAYNSSTFSLNYACDEVTQTLNYKGNGYSIRCIKEK